MKKPENWMWAIQKKNGKLRTFTIIEGVNVVGFCTKKGLNKFYGVVLPDEKIIKVDFSLPKVPKPKPKAKDKKATKKAGSGTAGFQSGKKSSINW